MRFTLAFLLAPVVFAQTPKRLEFEVASVKPVQQIANAGAQTPAGASVTPNQIRLSYLLMQDFITRAYGVKMYQIVGPDWLKTERYDIVATLPEGATQAQVPAMMKTLLEDRFGIKVHKSQKEFSVYMLTRSKRPFTLTEVPAIAPDSNESGVVAKKSPSDPFRLKTGKGGVFTLAPTKVEGQGMTMDMLVTNLATFLGLPMVNSTDIKGYYDFSLDVLPEDSQSMMSTAAAARGAGSSGQRADPISLFEALDKVGLKLEKAKAPLEVINIDELNKMPTEN